MADTFYVMEEIGVMNGTYVNGNRVATGVPIAVQNGDVLKFGLVSLTFQLPRTPDAAPSPSPAPGVCASATRSRAFRASAPHAGRSGSPPRGSRRSPTSSSRFPFRYEDRRHFASIAALAWDQPATLPRALPRGQSARRGCGAALLRVEAVADDGSGAVRVVWHNRYPSFAKALEGTRAALYGTPVATARGEMRIENPETELFEEGEESDPVHSGRIVGVYHRAADDPLPPVAHARPPHARRPVGPEFAAR